jgi:hypothetical protein
MAYSPIHKIQVEQEERKESQVPLIDLFLTPYQSSQQQRLNA